MYYIYRIIKFIGRYIFALGCCLYIFSFGTILKKNRAIIKYICDQFYSREENINDKNFTKYTVKANYNNRSDNEELLYCTVCDGLLRKSFTKSGICNDYVYYTCEICSTIQLIEDINDSDLKTENEDFGGRNTDVLMSNRLLRTYDYISDHGSIIDFGCGTGAFVKYLKQNLINKNVKVLCIDKNTELKLQDIPKDSVDIIFMIEVIEHLDKPNDILRGMSNVLKSGGVIYIETTFSDTIIMPEEHSYVDPMIGHRIINSYTGLHFMAIRNGFEPKKINANVFLLIKR